VCDPMDVRDIGRVLDNPCISWRDLATSVITKPAREVVVAQTFKLQADAVGRAVSFRKIDSR